MEDRVLKIWNELSLKQMIDIANKFGFHDYSALLQRADVREYLLNFKPNKRRLLREE